MIGKVWQWTSDWFDASKQYRVLRGSCAPAADLSNFLPLLGETGGAFGIHRLPMLPGCKLGGYPKNNVLRKEKHTMKKRAIVFVAIAALLLTSWPLALSVSTIVAGFNWDGKQHQISLGDLEAAIAELVIFRQQNYKTRAGEGGISGRTD